MLTVITERKEGKDVESVKFVKASDLAVHDVITMHGSKWLLIEDIIRDEKGIRFCVSDDNGRRSVTYYMNPDRAVEALVERQLTF